MKLKDKYLQKSVAGLPSVYREVWEIGNGFKIDVSIGHEICSLGVDSPTKDITYEIASLLGIDISEESLVKRNHDDEELYVSMGIDCVILNYRKPEDYMQLLKKIEAIVNDKFR